MKIQATEAVITYHAIRGSYGRVTYFMTKTDLRDVAENLELAPQAELKFSERIQRKINVNRVENELLPYLHKNELRFFNSLVCILLPDADRKTGFWSFEEYQDPEGNPIGGIGSLKLAKEVARVVLDGQHRYEALKRYWRSIKDDPARAAEAHIDVGLLFVVVDNHGQFEIKDEPQRVRVLANSRNLFAVLNKTAVSVDKNTLTLIDDSDVRNLITRQILEDGVVSDLWVKWSGGFGLAPTDPYFTGIQVLRDAVDYILSDLDGADNDFVIAEERQKALQKFYCDTPGMEISLRDFVAKLVLGTSAFAHWKDLLNSQNISLMAQPQETPLAGYQSKAISSLRNKELLFTIAGQKAIFRAAIDCFRAGKRFDDKNLDSVVARVDLLYRAGLLARNPESQGALLHILFDAKNRMRAAEGNVDCARKIFSIALGSSISKDAALHSFRVYSGREGEIVQEYWKACSKEIGTA